MQTALCKDFAVPATDAQHAGAWSIACIRGGVLPPQPPDGDIPMQTRKIAAMLAAAALVASAGSAFAAGNTEYYPFSEIMSMKMMDKNKDGMVSKKEFMDMMSMAWDMNAKKMNVMHDKMTTDEFNQLLQYLKAGG
jgi:hypothetical protein